MKINLLNNVIIVIFSICQILFAQDISTDWPTPYIFKEPVLLLAGTRLSVTAYYADEADLPQAGSVRLTVSGFR